MGGAGELRGSRGRSPSHCRSPFHEKVLSNQLADVAASAGVARQDACSLASIRTRVSRVLGWVHDEVRRVRCCHLPGGLGGHVKHVHGGPRASPQSPERGLRSSYRLTARKRAGGPGIQLFETSWDTSRLFRRLLVFAVILDNPGRDCLVTNWLRGRGGRLRGTRPLGDRPASYPRAVGRTGAGLSLSTGCPPPAISTARSRCSCAQHLAAGAVEMWVTRAPHDAALHACWRSHWSR